MIKVRDEEQLIDIVKQRIRDTKGSVIDLNDIDVSEIKRIDNFLSQLDYTNELVKKGRKLDIHNWKFKNLVIMSQFFEEADKWIHNFDDYVNQAEFPKLVYAEYMFSNTKFSKPVELRLPNVIHGYQLLRNAKIEAPVKINAPFVRIHEGADDLGIQWNESDYKAAYETVKYFANQPLKEAIEKLRKQIKEKKILAADVHSIDLRNPEDIIQDANKGSLLTKLALFKDKLVVDKNGVVTDIEYPKLNPVITLQKRKMLVESKSFFDFNDMLLEGKDISNEDVANIESKLSGFLNPFFKGWFAGEQTPYTQIALRSAENKKFRHIMLSTLCR